jgi:laminin, alpha 1/2
MGPRNVTIRYIRDQHHNRDDGNHVIVTHIRNNQIHRESGELATHNGLTVFPSYSGNVTVGSRWAFNHPFYFQLPKEFLGDKTRSYGGFLNFSVITEGCSSNLLDETLQQFPLVQLHTHFHMILDYYPTEILDARVSEQSYNVVLHESHWRYRSNGYNISRAIMMTALQNIKHIFLRATTSPDFTQVV